MKDFIPDSQFLPDKETPPAASTNSNPNFITDDKFIDDEEKYGTLGQQIKTGLEGIGAAATFGLSTGLETALGVDPADIRARREVNPGSHMIGQGIGLIGTAAIPILGEANALKVMTGAGNLATRAIGLGAAEGLAATAARGATAAAVENAIFQTGDEISKMLSDDPGQSVETALTNVGLSGLFGAGVGGALGAAPKLWKATVGEKGAQFLEDFRGRIKEHTDNPDPGAILSQELDDLYKTTKSAADEVYGPTGLKTQEAQKLMPEMGEKISTQASDLVKATEDSIAKLGDDPLANRMLRKLEDFKGAISGERDILTGGVKRTATPAEIFDAAQNFKQELQAWSKFNKMAPPPIAEREFVRSAKDLSHTFRTALEDAKVWGKVAERQGVINKAFSEYLPTLKNFESKFTTEIAGERVIDPGKVATYVNQAGKMSGSVRREMLGNFIEAAEKYKSVIDDSHRTLGIESPIEFTSLNAAKSSLKELTSGAKLADAIVKKGLANLSGDAVGAAAGEALLGGAVGLPGIGAIIGQHALGDFFASILPAIAKPILENRASSAGLRGSVEYGMQVIKGEALISKGARSVFKVTRETLPSKAVNVSEKERDRLDKKIAEMQENPESLLNIGMDAGYYMPGHAAAVGETAGRVLNYLNTKRPKPLKLAPLDEEIEPTKEEQESYQEALTIAEKPLSVLLKIQDNSLLPQDVEAIRTMYPGLYGKLSQSLTNEMIDVASKGEDIPYNLKQSLSLFLGQTLDSTLSHIGIQAAQSSFLLPKEPSPNEPVTKNKRNTSKLGELPERFQTAQQAAQSRRTQIS